MSEDELTIDEAVQSAVEEAADDFAKAVDAEVVETVIEEAKEEEEKPVVKKKRKYTKRKKAVAKEEVKEEPKKVEEPAPVAKAAKPDYTYKAWWGEVGSALLVKGYSAVGLLNRAKKAFGKDFDQAKYDEYLVANKVAGVIDKVEAIWLSQK